MKNNQATACQIWRAFLQTESADLVAVARPVIRQLGGINSETLQSLNDVSRCSAGAAGGFTGFIYYTETVEFWRKNRAKITALINYEADGLGENPLEMVCRFRSLEGFSVDEIGLALYGKYSDYLAQIYNTFAWFALEAVAFRFSEYLYDTDVDIYEL